MCLCPTTGVAEKSLFRVITMKEIDDKEEEEEELFESFEIRS